ncbi:methyltransferase domain-containing protein [Nonomuraea sp. KM90]|uniref:methyltransferase domain-containing protein n=1 Tax=Nonomuraea sp. KM90 TaxID=3457428 RepID=UPI003FCCCF2B
MTIDPWVDGRIDALDEYLVAAGVLSPNCPDSRFWRGALRRVPRHLFVPRRAWMQPQDDREEELIDQDTDPAFWYHTVYSNTALITQRGDGTADVADRSAPPTSSTSSPHVVFEFLRLLNPQDEHRVLEIGTGTGWTAALLAERVGDSQVTTVEVDKSIAEVAAENLKAADYGPTLLVGDGALGAPDHAPYDRVHVTCGVRDIPYPWVEQARPGAVIVMPWMPAHGGWGQRLRLDVLDDGTAVGSFHGTCKYMMMRAQRLEAWPPYPDDGMQSSTWVDPREPWNALDDGFGLHLAVVAPHLTITTAGWEGQEDASSAWVMRLRDLAHRDAWAVITARPGQDAQVSQSGGRQLWHTMEATYMEWLRAGRPGPGAYRMTVTPRGQDVWLR